MALNEHKKDVVLFGIGENYAKAKHALHQEFNVVGLIDNANIGEHSAPNQISNFQYDYVVVLPIKAYEMVEQLLNLGVCHSAIRICKKNSCGLQLIEVEANDNNTLTLLYNGVRISVDTPLEYMVYCAIFFGKMYDFYSPLLKLENIVIIDIGMYTGCATLYLASQYNICKIYSFEPFEENYRKAIANIAQNPKLSSKIITKNFGLSNQNASIQVTGDVVCNEEYGDAKIEISVRDAVEVLGEIFKQHEKLPMVLKCDCEGAEYEIFESLDNANLLSRFNIIVMEWHGTERLGEMKDRLLKNGFTFFLKEFQPHAGMIYGARTHDKTF